MDKPTYNFSSSEKPPPHRRENKKKGKFRKRDIINMAEQK